MPLVPNFSNEANSAAKRAFLKQECPICFDELFCSPVGTLCNSQNKPICKHSYHAKCVEELPKPWKCPLCRLDFTKVLTAPDIKVDPYAWFEFLDIDKSGSISYEELVDGLKSQILLNWSKIECDADTLWSKWDKDGNGNISIDEFCDPKSGVMAYLLEVYPTNPRPPPPDILKNKKEWFNYWDEDCSGSLDKDEMGRALVKTFKLYHIEKSTVIDILNAIWPIFDIDDSGRIECSEFISTDNLADTICAELQSLMKK